MNKKGGETKMGPPDPIIPPFPPFIGGLFGWF